MATIGGARRTATIGNARKAAIIGSAHRAATIGGARGPATRVGARAAATIGGAHRAAISGGAHRATIVVVIVKPAQYLPAGPNGRFDWLPRTHKFVVEHVQITRRAYGPCWEG